VRREASRSRRIERRDPTAFASDLKRKDFIVYIPFSETEACSKDFVKRFGTACLTMKPILGF
jgi:hypothetical protein